MEEVVTNKLLPLLVVVGLAAGCAAGVSSPPGGGEPLPVSSPLPTQTGESDAAPAGETPEAPSKQATPDVSYPAEHWQPPVDVDDSPHTLVGMARDDLAHRLRIDLVWVEVVEVVAREPDAEVMSCLAMGEIYHKDMLTDLGEVQWISLSVKGNIHHYVAFADGVIYCEE